ncbi:MAG: SHOCT domain-containing protein [Actinomycetota bacterium]|nr:SHOCT domain-containing protein [Actinomycetota bacterium]
MPCPFCPGGGFGGGIGFFFNLLFTIILLVGLGFLIWWIVRQVSLGRYGPPGPTPSDRALETLNERYARGEISKEEYEERKRILTGG